MKWNLKFLIIYSWMIISSGHLVSQALQYLDKPTAQFAISHGHCNLLANAMVQEIKIKSSKNDFSDISIDFSIDMNSLMSFSEEVTNELKSPVIFNTNQHPFLLFNCEDNFRLGDNWFQLRGDLTINGVTKYVRLMLTPERFESESGISRNHYYISGEVNLFDFGIQYPDEFSMNKTMFINLNLEK